MQRGGTCGDPPRLAPFVGEPAHLDQPFAVRGPGRERFVGVRALRRGDRGDHPVGGRQDARTRTEVGVQGKFARRQPVRAAELLLELEQVEEARAAPCVDALVGVAHGGHREAVSEGAGDEVRLGDVRVLVLVEHRRAEVGAILPNDLGVALDDVERERDLVAEVDDAELALPLPEPLHRQRELHPLERGPIRRLPAMLAELGEARLAKRDDIGGLTAVVRELVRERQDLDDDRRLPLRRHVFERDLVEHLPAELRALGRREHALPRFDPGEQAVSVEHVLRERMVIEDGRLLALGSRLSGLRGLFAFLDAGATELVALPFGSDEEQVRTTELLAGLAVAR